MFRGLGQGKKTNKEYKAAKREKVTQGLKILELEVQVSFGALSQVINVVLRRRGNRKDIVAERDRLVVDGAAGRSADEGIGWSPDVRGSREKVMGDGGSQQSRPPEIVRRH